MKNDLMNNSPDNVLDAERSILFTLKTGFIIGAIGLIGYPVTIAHIGARIIFIGLFIAIATFVSGFFTGTLFGMPKRNNEGESDYSLNNSLVEISDWLTKIIVGLGLVNLKQIPVYLMSLGAYVSASSGLTGVSMDIFTICVVVYFGILGLYTGYNYMRLVLSEKYKKADDNMLSKVIEENETLKEEKVQISKEADVQKEKADLKEEQTRTLLGIVNQPSLTVENFKSAFENFDDSRAFAGDSLTDKSPIDTMVSKAKLKLENGLKINENDPQKGQWNGKAINNGRQLTATVTEIGKWLFQINLKVSATDQINLPLESGEPVLFALHNSYGDPPFRLVKAEDGCAKLDLISYGSFTIGAFADQGNTELELDLAELPDVSDYFKTH